MSYYPKRPVKSFQDLEVYQKVSAIAVVVTKRLKEELNSADTKNQNILSERIPRLAEHIADKLLELPVLLATAHSIRFSDPAGSITKLDEVMLHCNLAVVNLEQFRDLGNTGIEPDFFEEQIKNLLSVRMKIMHLQQSWKKFIKMDKEK